MLKKTLIICVVLIIISCNKPEDSLVSSHGKVKEFIVNSEKVGTVIKENIPDKMGLLLSYPEYVVDSYNLIKFIASLLNESNDVTVYLPGYPEGVTSDSLIDILRVEAPMLGFQEIYDLCLYLEHEEIELTGELAKGDGIVLILGPEALFNETKTEVDTIFDPDEIISVVMVGTEETLDLRPIIEMIPEGKKISSIPINNLKYTKEIDGFDILVLMDEVKYYTLVSPIPLYTKSSYSLAPEDFLEEHSSIIESLTVKKLNSVLPKLISQYGEKL